MHKQEINRLIEIKTKELEKLKLEINNLKNLYNKNVLTQEEKITIYQNIFKGRKDIYIYLSTDKYNHNKIYYIQSCKNEWKKGICNKTMSKQCKVCKHRIPKPLTKEVITNHLFNNQTIAIYPLLEDETCFFLVINFDNEQTNREDVTAFLKISDKYQIPVYVEKDSEGKSLHTWIFFQTKIKAITARKLGSLLLSQTMEIRDNLDINLFDKMFPNQNYLPKGNYGNYIILPLQKELSKYNNTVFLDRNFKKIKDQFDYLNHIKKLSLDEVEDKIRNLNNNTIDISNQELNLKEEVKNKRKNNFNYPTSINIILDDMIYIEKTRLNPSIKTCFKRLATFANPEFYKKQQLRMSTYNTPMIIDCSKEDIKYLKLPRGTLEYLIDLCNNNSVKINIVDKRNEGIKLNINFKGSLLPPQQKALNKMLEYDNGILHAPTGFGKTVICCKLIEEKNVNTLVITHTIQLLKQWKERLKEFLTIEEVGQIGGGKNIITNKIDIASIKTIWNNGKFNNVVKNYGMIIIDECHHLAAFTYESAINTVNAKYIYGLTATPNRENGHTLIIKMQCGDIRYEVDFKKFNKNLQLPMRVYAKHNYLNITDKKIKDYTLNEINNLIIKDELRNTKILSDIRKEFNLGKNVLVLTERLEHLEYLKNNLLTLTNNLFIYHGGLGKKVLEKYKLLEESIQKNKQNKIIIATGSYIGEGFDDKTLDILFLTMPISGITKVIQYTGRLHRKNITKNEITVYDYVDDNFNQTRSMFEKRKKTYEKLGYEIINLIE